MPHDDAIMRLMEKYEVNGNMREAKIIHESFGEGYRQCVRDESAKLRELMQRIESKSDDKTPQVRG